MKIVLGPTPCHFCGVPLVLRRDHWQGRGDRWVFYWSLWHKSGPPSGSIHRCGNGTPAASAAE